MTALIVGRRNHLRKTIVQFLLPTSDFIPLSLFTKHFLPKRWNAFDPNKFLLLQHCVFGRRTKIFFAAFQACRHTALRIYFGALANAKRFAYANLSPKD